MKDRSPFEKRKALLLKENKRRIRYLTQNEIDILLKECQCRKHLHRIVICTSTTGMRKGEMSDLKWRQIRNGFIYLEKTKTMNKRTTPINEDLAHFLRKSEKKKA